MRNNHEEDEHWHRLRDEAADWFARLRADNLPRRDLRAFDDWLASHPEAMDAFLEVWRLWDETAVLRGTLLEGKNPVRLARAREQPRSTAGRSTR